MRHTTANPLATGAIAALLLLAGCAPAGDDSPCASTAECFQGQLCVKAACVSEAEAKTLLPDACQVPDGTTCDDPTEPEGGDDTYIRGRYITSPPQPGCATDGTFHTFGPMTVSGVKCTSDPADYVRVQLLTCRDRGLTIKARLATAPVCERSAAALRVRYNGAELSCEDERLRCARGEGGEQLITIVLPAEGIAQILTLSFGVDSGDREDVQLSYDLTLSVE